VNINKNELNWFEHIRVQIYDSLNVNLNFRCNQQRNLVIKRCTCTRLDCLLIFCNTDGSAKKRYRPDHQSSPEF